MYNYFLIIFFFLWFILSIGWQFKFDFLKKIGRFDVFGMLPNWTFFAPNPGVSDFHLIFRISSQDGQEVTSWIEIPFIELRKSNNFVWNPQRRYIKFLIDCINSMLLMIKAYREQSLSPEDITKRLCLSVPYLLVLNSVIKKIGRDNSYIDSYVQFAIVESYGLSPRLDPSPVIVSVFHAIN